MISRKLFVFLAASLFVFAMVGMVMAAPPGKDLKWEVDGAKPAHFSGAKHAEKGLACNDCHPKVFQMKQSTGKKMAEMKDEKKYCGHCHNGEARKIKDKEIVVFSTADPKNCAKCHHD